MLTPGNKKLGGRLIWGFGLPSGAGGTCPGSTPACRAHCYAARLEGYRPAAAALYRSNLAAARRRGFARRVRAFLVAHRVRVVRVHTGGDFFSARYARKWFEVARRSPRVRFFAYTRSWRVPAIRGAVDELAGLPNFRLWYSCDRDSGLPGHKPPGVRVAWLMTGQGDLPPAGADLAFRVRALRRRPLAVAAGARVCPAESGAAAAGEVTCDRCGVCWSAAGHRLPLPITGDHESVEQPPSVSSPTR